MKKKTRPQIATITVWQTDASIHNCHHWQSRARMQGIKVKYLNDHLLID